MGANVGQYTRGGNPAAMFLESNLYLELLCQAQKAAIDSDFNDIAFSRVTQMRRIVQNAIGDGSPNNGFKIAQSSISTTNNFKVTGGDGTDEGAGRLFVKGFPCFLKSDVDYTGAFTAAMNKIAPQVTGVVPLVLTDSTANWTVNEHAGKTLTPDITIPGVTFTIASNTANTITVTAGNLTTATAARKFYRIQLSTPGAPRTDEVYLDVFLDEQDDIEDPNFVNNDIAPPQSGPFRIVLRQFVRVTEGGVTPAPWTDADGRPHFPFKLATIARGAADPTIVTSMIADNRRVFVPGVASLTVETVGGGTVVNNVSEIVVPPGALTDLGGGAVQIDTGSGGGGGSSVGPVSRNILLTNDVGAIPPPNPGTLGTDLATLDFPHGSESAQYFEFTVPEDYFGGDINVDAIYKMSTAVAGPNNKIRLETYAELARVFTGLVDTTTYPLTAATLTVDTGTAVRRITVKKLTHNTFGVGDRIAVEVHRLGADGNDLHTGDWRVIGFVVSYTAQIATRAVVQSTDILDDTAAAIPTTPSSIGEIQTEDYPTGADAEQKCVFIVPDSWDGISDAQFRLDYAMSSAVLNGVVRIETSAEIANVFAGTVDTLPAVDFDVLPPNDTNPHRTVVLRSIPATALAKGDHIVFKIRRITSGVVGNHGGSFKLINVSMIQGQAPATGFTVVRIIEQYLKRPAFNAPTGTLTIDDGAFPSFAGDFETYATFAGGASGGTVKAAYEGRIASDGSKIDSISLHVKGTGTAHYQVQVYVEGAGNTPVYDSGTVAAPGAATELSILDINLSAQPSAGKKRFFVVVSVTLAAGDTFSTSTPFVRQE